MLQILKTFVDFGPLDEPKIVLESMCVLNYAHLPVMIQDKMLDSVVFNFFEMNTFFVIGKKNTDFDQNELSNNSANISKSQLDENKVLENQILLEKFYINNGDDLTSKTLGYL